MEAVMLAHWDLGAAVYRNGEMDTMSIMNFVREMRHAI